MVPFQMCKLPNPKAVMNPNTIRKTKVSYQKLRKLTLIRSGMVPVFFNPEDVVSIFSMTVIFGSVSEPAQCFSFLTQCSVRTQKAKAFNTDFWACPLSTEISPDSHNLGMIL